MKTLNDLNYMNDDDRIAMSTVNAAALFPRLRVH